MVDRNKAIRKVCEESLYRVIEQPVLQRRAFPEMEAMRHVDDLGRFHLMSTDSAYHTATGRIAVHDIVVLLLHKLKKLLSRLQIILAKRIAIKVNMDHPDTVLLTYFLEMSRLCHRHVVGKRKINTKFFGCQNRRDGKIVHDPAGAMLDIKHFHMHTAF